MIVVQDLGLLHCVSNFKLHIQKTKKTVIMEALRKNLKSLGVIGVVVGGILVATYPIIIAPYMDPRPWHEVQNVGRQGIDREKIQPGGMKVWTDPFEKKN
ncbi:small integral membrane protein 20 [Aplysia californica]|uniref:Small integral membrane protein 20 n=1 Tax=Aplysia californica TaxID=6500 RepID=A0ABM0JL27_APLCA|nr:small integral membrane protein 20 [Aplysia californica]